jgi:hypothetical protein
MGFVNQLGTGGVSHCSTSWKNIVINYQVIILKQGGVLWGYNGDTTYINQEMLNLDGSG